MLSKAQIKYIRSLTQQKYRKEHNVFIAEGDKIAREWLDSAASIEYIIGVESWMDENSQAVAKHGEATHAVVPDHVLASISALQTPNKVLLVVRMSGQSQTLPISGWSIALDTIQDPGNMGTIIRIADWFGIQNIVCSPDCVDVYNPKVVQSAMGGHLRVNFHVADLDEFVSQQKIPVLAASLNGSDIYKMTPLNEAVLIIGNESKGIDAALLAKCSHQVTIPRRGGAESLNAAVSAGIICSHLIR